MKSFVFSPAIERNLVKMLLIVFLSINSSLLTFSNPIMPPPLIIEIYFSPEGWQIEMMNSEYGQVNNLDNIWLCGIYDTAQFISGIEFIPGEVLVMTQDDLMTGMEINQDGDWLTLYYIFDNNNFPVDELGLLWGNIPVTPYYYFNRVTAPVGEQSIAVQELYDFGDFCVVKEKPNSIGFNPFEVLKRADFSGLVRDSNDGPLAGVEVSHGGYPLIITGSDGYFSTSDNMYCRIYDVNFVYDGGIIGDSTISIEPDSANYFEFKLDTLLTGISDIQSSTLQYSIFNIPNPSSSQVSFIIETTNLKPDQKGVIKIYSEAGYIVDIVPVELNSEKQELVYNFNDKSLSSGLYFYSLEVRNHKVASGKMVITR
jgi:hypothetical protein